MRVTLNMFPHYKEQYAEQQRKTTKTAALQTLESNLLSIPSQSRAMWDFKKTFGLEDAITAAENLIVENLKTYWDNPEDTNREPKNGE